MTDFNVYIILRTFSDICPKYKFSSGMQDYFVG